MSIFSTRPALRWGVPALTIVVVAGGGAALRTVSAVGADNLPHRSAQQLLVDVQGATVQSLSGTIVENANLGLPELPISGSAGGNGSSQLSSLISGSHTMKVWIAGPEQVRLSLLGTMGESDVIRNGTDLWTWSSADHAATHVTLPATPAGKTSQPMPAPSGVAMTPQQAAGQLLKAIGPSTEVTTDRTARVAGRSAYELVLTPREQGSLIASARIAIDAKTHIPLRVQVFSAKAKKPAKPAFEVGFSSVSFGQPDAAQFRFNPPPNTKVTQQKLPALGAGPSGMPGPGLASKAPLKSGSGATAQRPEAMPQVVGSGWTSVIKATLPPELLSGPAKTGTTSHHRQGTPSASTFMNALPKVSGAWGSGRLLSGTVFSALLTDSGTVYAGAVTPAVLYAAAAQHASTPTPAAGP